MIDSNSRGGRKDDGGGPRTRDRWQPDVLEGGDDRHAGSLDAAAMSRARWMYYAADPDAYRQYKDWDESGAADGDPQLRRIVRVLHLGYAEGQRDPATIEEMTELAKVLDEAYTNFRPEVDGQRLTANAIDEILRVENDSEKRRAAWEGSKQIGPRVADQIRRLAELRNEAAHRMGYAEFPPDEPGY